MTIYYHLDREDNAKDAQGKPLFNVWKPYSKAMFDNGHLQWLSGTKMVVGTYRKATYDEVNRLKPTVRLDGAEYWIKVSGTGASRIAVDSETKPVIVVLVVIDGEARSYRIKPERAEEVLKLLRELGEETRF